MADLGIKVKLTPDGKESDFQNAVNKFKPTVKVGIDKVYFVDTIKSALKDPKIQNFSIPIKAVIDAKQLSSDVQKALNAIQLAGSGITQTGSKAAKKSFSMTDKQIVQYQKRIEDIAAKRKQILNGGFYDQSLMSKLGNDIANINKLKAGTEGWKKSVDELALSFAKLKNSSDALKQQSQASKKANAELEKYKQTLERVKNWTNTTEARALVPKSELEQLKTYISSAEAAGQNTKQWRDEIDKASEAQKRMAAEISKNSAAQSRQNSMMSGATHANNIYSQISGILDKNPRIKENIALYEEFLRIQRESLKLDPSNTGGWRKLSQDLSRAKAQMNELGLTTETLGQRLVRLFKDHFNTAVAMAALHALQNALIGIYQNVKDIDRAMTDLRKVSSGTAAQYSEFLSGAADRAKEIGATISDVVDASAEFSRLGFNLDQSSVLGDAAVMYKNVSEYENIEDAAQSIVSTMQAFGVEAKDVMTIVDRFNEVGNNFAISSEGLGEAMKRSAAALALAGNSLDESLALVTGANEIVQSPEVVGTWAKTLTMYLRAAKVEAEDAGIETEGMANSVSELRESILKLTGNKVDIMVNDTEFKSALQIMREIASVYDSLTDVDQAALLKLLSGKRQANTTAALLSNWSTVEEVIQSSANSVGSAAAENAKYLDSIEGKMQQFSAQFQALSNQILDSGLVKGAFDQGTGILGFLTDAIQKLGTLKGLIVPVASLLATITNKGQFKQNLPLPTLRVWRRKPVYAGN